MDTTDALAIVAIVVAATAFFVTVSQVLQQYFATAEGYRRCQYSVMGQWSGFTYRKFRWSEFRFETRFITPHIRFGGKLGENFEIEQDHIPLLLSTVEIDEKKKKEDLEAANRDIADWVCWVPLVEHIEKLQTDLIEEFPKHAPALHQRPKNMTTNKTIQLPTLNFGRKRSQHTPRHYQSPVDSNWIQSQIGLQPQTSQTSPAASQQHKSHHLHQLELATCSLRKQSWDFMPSEVVKPLASMFACGLQKMPKSYMLQ